MKQRFSAGKITFFASEIYRRLTTLKAPRDQLKSLIQEVRLNKFILKENNLTCYPEVTQVDLPSDSEIEEIFNEYLIYCESAEEDFEGR